jgi:hypothetical protein
MLKEKELRIQNIEYRLKISNGAVNQWFQKYEEMKEKFYSKDDK